MRNALQYSIRDAPWETIALIGAGVALFQYSIRDATTAAARAYAFLTLSILY